MKFKKLIQNWFSKNKCNFDPTYVHVRYNLYIAHEVMGYSNTYVDHDIALKNMMYWIF